MPERSLVPRNWIPRLLSQRDWSDGELALRTGLPRAHVNRVKNRRVQPTLRDALAIAGAFGMAVEDVFVLDDAPPSKAERPAPGR